MDLFWRDSLTCPSETEYIEMVNNKTGGLLRLAVKLMQACSTSTVYSTQPITCMLTRQGLRSTCQFDRNPLSNQR